ncbi:MAG TPA: GIY-YIG nuclease family protein [Gemmatales bacterium]|nr:GIY-YIG nuclease family protein [Gemmatales bacterium]
MPKTLFSHEPFAGLGCNRYDLPPGDTICGGSIVGDGRASLRRGVKSHAPQIPGVYAMVDADGNVLYVGKAKRLRARLLNYFRNKSAERRKAQRLLLRTQRIVWEYAPHEFAALLRELELIRLHRPRFNVMGQPLLRRRAYVCLGRAPAPYAYVSKEPPSQGEWFGPLIARPELTEAVRHLNDVFRLRDCPKQQTMRFADQASLIDDALAPGCIRFDMGTCPGPCAARCTAIQYRSRVQAARRFLLCQDESTLEKIRQEMLGAASGQDYERATVLRDRMQQLDWLLRTLQRLKMTREELSFIYPVTSAYRPGQTLWYLIHEGQWRNTIEANTAESADVTTNHALIRDVYQAAPKVGIRLESIDHVWLIAAWFRKFPEERDKCLDVSSLLDRKWKKAV